MDHLDGDGALANGGGHPLDRAVSRVTDGEDAGYARLHWQGKASQVPSVSRSAVARQVATGENEALLVAF